MWKKSAGTDLVAVGKEMELSRAVGVRVMAVLMAVLVAVARAGKRWRQPRAVPANSRQKSYFEHVHRTAPSTWTLTNLNWRVRYWP